MSPHRIYILPTRSWAVLTAVLVAIWYAAISQNNGAAYLLMFFLGSLVLVTAIHAHFALAGLRLRADKPEPVFAGETLRVLVEVYNPTVRPRPALAVAANRHVFKELTHAVLPFLEGESSQTTELALPTAHRGRFELRRMALTTLYPMGFFRSWRYEPTDASYLVYPTPAGSLPLPEGLALMVDEVTNAGAGGDDYMGVRAYQSGESQRHVDWRAVARGQPLLVKQFSGAGSRRVWLEYGHVVHLPDVEQRLSQLSAWIVEADRTGCAFGLRLPDFEAEPARGHAHIHRCLAALAQFENPGHPASK